MPRKKRPPTQEITLRRDESLADAVQEVVGSFVAGTRETEVLETLRKAYPDLKPEEVLTAAVTHFMRVGTVRQEGLIATFGFCLEATKEIYRRLLLEGDFVNALKAVKQIKDLADQAATLQPPGDEQDVRDEGQGRPIREEENPGSRPSKEDGGERP